MKKKTTKFKGQKGKYDLCFCACFFFMNEDIVEYSFVIIYKKKFKNYLLTKTIEKGLRLEKQTKAVSFV